MKKIIIIGSLWGLAGCSSYQEKFECAPGKGVGCHSVSHIDRMVEQGELPYPEDDSRTESIKPHLKQRSQNRNKPISLGTHRQRLWLPGYEDAHGHYHSERYIFISDSKGGS